jgi:hypothetical protein
MMAEDFCKKEEIDRKEISFSKIEKSLKWSRRLLWPSEIPNSIEDVLEAIEKHQDKPVLQYYQETVRYSTNNQNDISSVIFGRRELIDEFEKSTEVGQEGSFKITPSPFSHVYIVTFKYKTHWFPAFVCLMAFKDKSAYTETFNCIYSNLVPQFQGSKIRLELEPESKEATVSVLKKISVENSNRSYLAKTKLKGCIFYYGSCILRNIKRNGLIMKYSRSLPFNRWVKRLLILCFLPAIHIKSTWNLHLKNMKFNSFNTVNKLLVEDFKRDFEDQWIHNTEADFLSIFETELNVTNEHERFRKKINKKESTNGTLWNFLDRMNELLENAVLDLNCLKDNKIIVQKQPRMNEDDLKHRKYAEAQLLSKDFTAIQFVDFLAENFGKRFFNSIDPDDECENEAVVAGLEFDINKDFENVDDFELALNSSDPCTITEEFTESYSYKKDENSFKVNSGCAKRGLKRDSNQQTFSYQEDENHLLKIKKSRNSEELDQSYEQEEPSMNDMIDELSTPEESNDFIPNDYLSTIENSKCYDEQEKDKDNSQIPEVGSNYTSTKFGKSVVYHHEGFNYNKSKMNTSGKFVSLRCQLSRSRKEEKCAGTARLDVNKKYIYLKAPHNHKPNEKSSKIQTFFKRVRNECEKLPTQLHKFKFQEMKEEFCEKEGIDPTDINFSMVESSCYRRAKKHVPSEDSQLFENMQETIDKYNDKVVEERVKTGKLCPICGKNIKQDLKPHMERVHEGKKDCLCLICGSIFYADKDLKAHIKSVHEKLKPHKCSLCDSSFFKSYGLRQHTESVHEGKRPFKCSLCDSDFGSKSSLNFHIVSVHEKKKPFKCSKCEMAFGNRHKLKRHTDVVHEGIKPYICSVCDMAFGNRPHLRRHTDVVHEQKKPYLCPDCGLGFAQNDKLQRHISAVHKKEKPFSCMECNASFAYLYRLTRHTTAVHEGIKPKSKASKK